MADSKLTALTAETTFAGDELVFVVDDPSGTPVDRKATIQNVVSAIAYTKAQADAAYAAAGHNHSGTYQPLDADLTALAAAGNSATLAATTASFTTADETKLDGIEAGATTDQSAAEILTAIKTVDGTGSGLDADTVDGTEASALLDRANHTGTQAQSTVANLVSDLAGKVDKTTFDANTILKADTDDTPSALTVAASRIVGRKASGSIGALTLAEVVALGGTPDGTKFLRDDGTLATPSGGGSVLPPIRSNTTHPTVAPGLIRLAFANAQFTAAANTTYYFGPYLTGGITIDAGIFNINAVTGTANVRWAIIPIDTSTWQPSGVTIDFGSNSYTTGGQKTITISSTPIAAGSYFVGLKTDNATLQLKGMTAQPVTGWRGSENGYQTIRHRSKAETFGAWAATPTAWDTATSIASTGTAGLDHLLDWRVA